LPVICIVIFGCFKTALFSYNKERDGIAIAIKIAIGINVHTTSKTG
jgi:hypothetical protein